MSRFKPGLLLLTVAGFLLVTAVFWRNSDKASPGFREPIAPTGEGSVPSSSAMRDPELDGRSERPPSPSVGEAQSSIVQNRITIETQAGTPWPVRTETTLPSNADGSPNRVVTTRMVADRYLVELLPETDTEKAALDLQAEGVRARSLKSHDHVLVVNFDLFAHNDALPLSMELARRVLGSRAASVEPDYLVSTHRTVPTDPRFQLQWGLSPDSSGAGIQAPEGWDVERDAGEIVVAVIDSGLRLTHEDLRDNLWVNRAEIPGNQIDDDSNGYVDDVHGIDALLGLGDPSDALGHGTHVGGIIGATGNNGTGITGVAWNVQLMALKFIQNEEGGATSDAVECIEYAIENGAHIINASWGGPGRSSILEASIRKAGERNILFVASAGNEGTNIDISRVFPAGFELPSVIAIASIESDGSLSGFSNHGFQRVTLAAPGGNIYSTLGKSDSAYGYASGTSMAAPHVAAVAALLLSTFGSQSPEALADRLYRTVRPTSRLDGAVASEGVLDLRRALTDASSNPSNDDFEEAITITGSSFHYSGTISFATAQTGEPNPFQVASLKTVWFRLTLPYATGARVRVRSSQFAPGLSIFRGDDLSGLDLLAVAEGDRPTLDFEVDPGVPHMIAVQSLDGFRGRFDLTVETPAANDTFVQASLLTGSTFTASGDNRLATNEPGEAPHGAYNASRSLWWRWVAPKSGYFVLSTFGSDHDTDLAVYTGTTLKTLERVAANDNAGSGVVYSSVAFDVVAGQHYRLAVDSNSTYGGSVALHGTYETSVWFTVEPADQSTLAGYTVIFQSQAEGQPPIIYQWFKDDKPIPGADRPNLQLTSVTKDDLGLYQVKATGPSENAISRKARLSFDGQSPRIVKPPTNGAYYIGETIRSKAVIEGATPMTIQWYRDGQPIGGANGLSLTIPNAESGHTGHYTVRAANAFGTAKSPACRIEVTEPDPNGWHFRYPSVRPGVQSVAFINNRFFAYGRYGRLYESTDGEFWTTHTFPFDGYLEQILYGNGRYLAVSNSGSLWTAGDDLQWNGPVIEGDFAPGTMVFGNGVFLSLTYQGPKFSTNGTSWTRINALTDSPSVLFHLNDRFLAVWYDYNQSGQTHAARSTDGRTWSKPAPVDGNRYEQAAVINGALYVFTHWYPSMRTEDGSAWTPGPLLAGGNGRSFIVGQYLFHFYAYDSPFSAVPLGGSAKEAVTVAPRVTSVAYGNNRFVIVQPNGELHAVDPNQPETFGHIPDPGPGFSSSSELNLEFVNGKFYIDGGQWLTTTDGVGWDFRDHYGTIYTAPGNPAAFTTIAYGNGVYTTGELTGFSPDYLTLADPGAVSPPSRLTFGNGRFVGTAGPALISSTDGQNWTETLLSFDDSFGAIAYGNGRYVAVGASRVAVSTDGQTWTRTEIPQHPDEQFVRLNAVAYGLDSFVVTSSNGALYRSSDGLNWTRFLHGFRGTIDRPNEMAPLLGIAFGNGVFIVTSHDWIFRSKDLDQWTREKAPARGANAIAFGNGTFIAAAGGTFIQLGQTANEPPSVSFQEPVGAVTLSPNASQLFEITGTDPEGQPILLQLMANGQEVARSSSGKLTTQWTPSEPGTFTMVARVEDAGGLVSESALRLRVRGESLEPISLPDHPTNPTNAVLFGNQYFVLDGAGQLWRSSNLDNWATVYTPEGPYGSNLVANRSGLLFQSDGIAFTRDGLTVTVTRPDGTDRDLSHLSTDGESGFLLRAESIQTTFDGQNWRSTGPLGHSVDFLAMNRGMTLAVESRWESGTLITREGQLITVALPAPTEHIRGLFSHEGHFYLKGNTWVARSVDGRAWRVWQIWDQNEISYQLIHDAFTEGDTIILFGWDATPIITTDQEHWDELPITGVTSIVRFDDALFAATRDRVYRSDNLTDWAVVHQLPSRGGYNSTLSHLVAGPAGLLVVADDGVGLGYTRNGIDWIQFHDADPNDRSNHIIDLAFGNGVWVATTENAGLKVGTDLASLEFTQPDLRAAFFNGTEFVAVSRREPDTLAFSTDGRTWQQRTVTVPKGVGLSQIAYLKDSGRYVAKASSDTFYTTADFVEWTYGEFRDRIPGLLATLNGYVIAYAEDGAFRHTTDGQNWYRIKHENAYGHLHWANGTFLRFIQGSSTNPSSVALSHDLETWEFHPLPNDMPGIQYLAVRPTNEGFIIWSSGYSYGDRAYFTPDGIQWRSHEPPTRFAQPVHANGRWYYLDREIMDFLTTDLVLKEILTVGGPFGAEEGIDLTLIVENASGTAVEFPEGVTVAAHLTTEPIWSPRPDSDLGRGRTGPVILQPHATAEFTVTLNLPADVSPGAYRVAGWLDSANRIPELSKFNNYAWTTTDSVQIEARTLSLAAIGDGTIQVLPFRPRYARNARVTLNPAAAPGSVFTRWDGVSESHLNTVTIQMNEDRNITAHFARYFDLSTEIEGRGRIEIAPESGVYFAGDQVEATAVADSGWSFYGWAGDRTGSEETLALTIDRNVRLSARFHMSHESWKAATFSANQLDDPDISGDHADPDGDGSINQAEFLFGTDPLSPASLPWVRMEKNSRGIILRFPVRALIDLESIGLEISRDTQEWTLLDVRLSPVKTNPGAGRELVEIEIDDDVANSPVFIRFILKPTHN